MRAIAATAGVLCLMTFTACSRGRCLGAEVRCGDACVDTTQDPANCGGCGIACGPADSCTSSYDDALAATVGACCHDGGVVCGPHVCSDLTSDPMNCGNCGVACHFGERCVALAHPGLDAAEAKCCTWDAGSECAPWLEAVVPR